MLPRSVVPPLPNMEYTTAYAAVSRKSTERKPGEDASQDANLALQCCGEASNEKRLLHTATAPLTDSALSGFIRFVLPFAPRNPFRCHCKVAAGLSAGCAAAPKYLGSCSGRGNWDNPKRRCQAAAVPQPGLCSIRPTSPQLRERACRAHSALLPRCLG